MTFKHYSKIPSLRNAVLDNAGRGEDIVSGPILLCGTVKIHGTHGDIVRFATGDYHIQSRNRIIDEGSDNNDFAHYCNAHWECINILFDRIAVNHSVTDNITISGEWCGSGIQKGVAVNRVARMFVYYDVFIDNVRQDITRYRLIYNESVRVFHIMQFPSYYVRIANFLDMSVEEIEGIDVFVREVDAACPVAAHFGMSGIGEGIVWRNNDICFKTKGMRFLETQVNKKEKTEKKEKKEDSDLDEEILAFITEERFHQGIQYMTEMHIDFIMKNITVFLNWIENDLLVEEKHAFAAMDSLTKTVQLKSIKVHSAKWYKAYILF